MSKRGSKRDDDETLSQNEEPPRKNPKTSAAGDVSDDSDQIHICDLSKNRKVSVRNWQGKTVVDIREFYVKDGKEFPGKKGYLCNNCLTIWSCVSNESYTVKDINDKHVHHRCSMYGSLPTSLSEKLMVFDGCYCGRASIVENGPVVEQIYNTLSGVLEVKHLKE